MQQLRFLITACLLFSIHVSFAVNPTYQEYLIKVERINNSGGESMDSKSVSGRFDGKTTETITLFPYTGESIDGEYYYNKWILVSKNGTIDMRVIDSYWPEIVLEGDLDGNGKDEFGVLLTGMHGATALYKILTVSNGRLVDFLDLYVMADGEEDITSFARKGNDKGKIFLNYMEPSWDGPQRVRKTVAVTKFLSK